MKMKNLFDNKYSWWNIHLRHLAAKEWLVLFEPPIDLAANALPTAIATLMESGHT
jgi:hypothetical protein